MTTSQLSPTTRAILAGGLAAGVLDGVDAIVAFKAVLGLGPVAIYQFVASGMLGSSAFSGGIPAALVGLGVHFLIAFTAAAVFVLASRRIPELRRHWLAAGAAFGLGVYVVMTYVVIPLSQIPPSPFSLPLFLNGVIGHALFVGLPIAWSAARFAPAASEELEAAHAH